MKSWYKHAMATHELEAWELILHLVVLLKPLHQMLLRVMLQLLVVLVALLLTDHRLLHSSQTQMDQDGQSAATLLDHGLHHGSKRSQTPGLLLLDSNRN